MEDTVRGLAGAGVGGGGGVALRSEIFILSRRRTFAEVQGSKLSI